jgi:hypothetical protein
VKLGRPFRVETNILFKFVLSLEIQLSEGKFGFGIRLNGLPPPSCCACLNPRIGFPMSYVMVCFVFSKWWWEVVARFVDIGAIVYPQCLNILYFVSLLSDLLCDKVAYTLQKCQRLILKKWTYMLGEVEVIFCRTQLRFRVCRLLMDVKISISTDRNVNNECIPSYGQK